MVKPEESKSGCFSGFFCVLLCAGNGPSPPVHPSDNVIESEETNPVLQNFHQNQKKDTNAIVDEYAATPGVVARLMGLDSLPKTNLLTKRRTSDSVPRSRSVNFMDYLLEIDLNQTNNHRRVKTSASFREVPALAQRENRDLLVLYWGDYVKKGDKEAKLKKTEKGLGETKLLNERVSTVMKEKNQGKSKKISKLKNEPRKVPCSSSSSPKRGRMVKKHLYEAKDLSTVSSSSSSNASLPNKKMKGFGEPKLTVNKRNQKSPKKIETENRSENLSPVFVLENDSTDNRHCTSPLASKKWKSSSLLSIGNDVEDKASHHRSCACGHLNREAEYYSELLMKLHTLTEKDIRESDITPKRMYENEGFQEICLFFEHKILDLLLHEFVNEVVG
ncbi:hypothetical protein RIF29_00729 [Crotalaria pallida]|uniref:DUF3741 domain-containing protein n=1 Tax=Crotalaria pallida TaxID=3830 RepID=A0AAN9P7D4_CROPI